MHLRCDFGEKENAWPHNPRMGFLATIRDALALPALAAQPVPAASPWHPGSHLISLIVDEDVSSHRSISREIAMSIPALARARRLITASIARCPLQAIKDESPLEHQPSWLARTDGPVSPFHRMLWTIDDLLFHGWSLWAIERGVDGQVLAADRVPIGQWSVHDGQVVWGGQPVDAASVCLIPGLDEGLLTSAAGVIRHADAIQRAASKAADTPIAHTELHQTKGQPLSPQEIEALVDAWIKARRSPTGAVSYTSESIEVKTHGTFDSALLLEGRAAAALDIARVTGIPAILLDAAGGGDTTIRYANIDARNTELIDFCLAPFMAAVAARLGMDDMVPRGTAISFDTTELTGLIDHALTVPDDQGDSKNEV